MMGVENHRLETNAPPLSEGEGMERLSEQACIPCTGQSSPLTQVEIDTLLPQVPEWRITPDRGESHLYRIFPFPDFRSALEFTQSVGEAAEKAGHHPALLTEWGKVTVTWWTHAIKGLHKNDFIMAQRTDEIAAQANTHP
jgi:4a-hydroxytetrahydrobiopterin dehydratase